MMLKEGGGGVTWRYHDDVTCGKKNCEQPLMLYSGYSGERMV